MQIEQIKIDNLIPYVNNPKAHPPAQIDKIASSIKNFGFLVPLVVDKGNEVIAGHGRLEAARKLGMTEAPCIRAENLTPAQVKAYRIADNKLAESEWFPELIGCELSDLANMGVDLGLTGFEEHEQSELMSIEEKTALGEPVYNKRNLGYGEKRIKPVISVEDISTFERAIKATGEINRGKAVIKICEAYLNDEGRAKRQHDAALESLIEASVN
jgi:ParB-like chromosome segregation protein Spo0J